MVIMVTMATMVTMAIMEITEITETMAMKEKRKEMMMTTTTGEDFNSMRRNISQKKKTLVRMTNHIGLISLPKDYLELLDSIGQPCLVTKVMFTQ